MTSKCALSGFTIHNNCRKAMAHWGQKTGGLYFPQVFLSLSIFFLLHVLKAV